jgi:phosphatidylserine decarboxylase
MLSRLFIAFLLVLPKHLVSRMGGWLASFPVPVPLRAWLYSGFCRVFGARAEEAEHPFEHYPSLNAWFTRGLRPGLRPVTQGALVSPVDGAVGASGQVKDGTLWQAKGRFYSLSALLGDHSLAAEFANGSYLTLYLAPRDYHRIHAPLDAMVVSCRYIPGKLWPVNAHAVAHVKELFAVNERLVVELRSAHGGAMALVAVGATMGGKTRVVFDDIHTHARRACVDLRRYAPPIHLLAGGPLGHFEFGSTVVLVCSQKCGALSCLPVGSAVRMGQAVGQLSNGASMQPVR